MAKLVTGTYGEALFELAVEEEMESVLLEEVEAFQAILKDNPEFSDMMNHPKIPREDKIKTLENIMSHEYIPRSDMIMAQESEVSFSKELTGFLVLILQKDRYSEIDGILEFFVKRMKEHMKIGTAYVTTAISLKDSQKIEIEKKLLETTEYKTMEMIYNEDPSLIGGMVIRIGDRVVDSSIKSKLDKLTKELLASSVG